MAATLQPLGDLPGGAFDSLANAVSADGSVVVGSSDSGSGDYWEAFRWTAVGGMVGLGDLAGGDFYSGATSVSADGSVVVGDTNSSGGQEAFRWTAGGGMVGLGHLARGTGATGVSADGSVVVVYSLRSSGYTDGFRWTADGGMVDLGQIPGNDVLGTYPTGVSADGSVVVGYSFAASEDGFRWSDGFRWTTGGGMVSLSGGGGEIDIYPNAVSGDGSVVVGSFGFAGGFEAFRWTAGVGFVELGNGWTYGVSADGSVVVGASGSGAYRWTVGNGMQRLWDLLLAQGVDPAAGGWSSLDRATGVSADGNTIVGYGTRNGNIEAFRAFVPITVAHLPGDFNHDGTVDSADYTVWRDGLNTTFTHADYDVWKAHFGQSLLTVGAGSLAAAPEPPTAVLFGVALAGIGVASRRRMRRNIMTATKSHARVS
jgi:probable HAF family extracellular repeat protein